jgi:hypothetical protein
MSQYTISWKHVSPPQPEFTVYYNQNTRGFSPASNSWIDDCTTCSIGAPEADVVIQSASFDTTEDARGVMMSNIKLISTADFVVPLNGCNTKPFTWTHKSSTPQQLGTNPDPVTGCYEGWSSYYYFVTQDPSVRTGDIKVLVHYRGQNPIHTDLSTALGDDVFRAICWRESTWRQFDGTGRPLFHKNANGSVDWGCMQINNAQPNQIWDWRDNVAAAKALFSQKRQDATKYLSAHPPVTPDMIERETLQRYNGGRYYQWNATTKHWDAAPPNQYVSIILDLITTKPWGVSFFSFDA